MVTDPELSLELKISPIIIAFIISITSLMISIVNDFYLKKDDLPYNIIVLFSYLFLIIVSKLYEHWANPSRIISIVEFVLFVLGITFWGKFPFGIMLIVLLPPIITSYFGLRWGGSFVIVVSILLFLFVSLNILNFLQVWIVVILSWTMFGIFYSLLSPATTLAGWAWQYYRDARNLLDEARSRQGELNRAVSDLSHLNEQLARMNALAQTFRHEAEEARQAKVQFVANVSHELRTPLNMIVGFSDMILDHPEVYGADLSTSIMADLSVIRRNAEHLGDLIDDVLDLSQIESNLMNLVKEWVPVSTLVYTVVEAVKPLFVSKKLSLNVNIENSLPMLHCDPIRIREVLLNLLSNAGRYTDEGRVDVIVRREADDLLIRVIDTGPGILPEKMHELFQPFRQIDNSLHRRNGGTGLGLSISKHFIELHGGKIWVESTPGQGTTFFVRLPLVEPAPVQNRYARWIIQDWDIVHKDIETPIPPKEIRPRLIVLDNKTNFTRLLGKQLPEYEIVPVSSVDDAIGQAQITPSGLFLLISDSVASESHRDTIMKVPGNLTMIQVESRPTLMDLMGKQIFGSLTKPIKKEDLHSILRKFTLVNKTVLIIDDEPEVLRLFHRMIKALNKEWHVLRAKSGEEAIFILGQYKVDLILLDLILPKMNGIQFTDIVSRNPKYQQIPIITISAQDSMAFSEGVKSLSISRQTGIQTKQVVEIIKTLDRSLASG